MIYKKIVTFCIIVLFFGAGVFPNISANDKKNYINQNENNSLNSLETQYTTNFNPDNSNYFYSKPHTENPSTIITETVNILEDGTLKLQIEIDASSVSLVELYKESFGIPLYESTIDMEVPINTTRIVERNLNGEITKKEVIEPVREKFFKGVSEEQKSLFGFYISEFTHSRIK